MSDRDRYIRALQDKFLQLRVVKAQIRDYGDGHTIGGVGTPTFRQVRDELLPEWEDWFAAYLEGD